MTYMSPGRLTKHSIITDPRIPDPENLPEPLGWNLLLRPYPIIARTRGGIILNENSVDFMNNMLNVARVVKIGPCCWTQPQHRIDGVQKPWVKVGDFVSYPFHVGATRKFKGVTYKLVGDDEIVEYLPDPQVFENDYYILDLGTDEELAKMYNEKGELTHV